MAYHTMMDLPYDILENIVSYLKPSDLASFSCVCQHFDAMSFCQKSFDFSDNTYTETEIIRLLRKHQDHITTLNLNYCNWLSSYTLLLAMKLPQLRHLHVIDCDVLKPCKEIPTIFPRNLKSFSFRWDSKLVSILKYRKALQNLEKLTICYLVTDGPQDFTVILKFVMENCPNLQHLHIYSPKLWAYFQPDFPNCEDVITMINSGNYLTKLSKLHLNFDLTFGNAVANSKVIAVLIKNIKLDQLHLGKLTIPLLHEEDPELKRKILRMLCNKKTEINLDASYHNIFIGRQFKLPTLAELWKDQVTQHLKIVSMRHLAIHNLKMTALTMAKMCPALQQLDLTGSVIEVPDLVLGMSAIAVHFSQLSYLNLDVRTATITNPHDWERLGHYISLLKGLKVLYLRAHLIGITIKTDSNFDEYLDELEQEQMTTVPDGHPFQKITTSCSQIEELYLINLSEELHSFMQFDVLCIHELLLSVKNCVNLDSIETRVLVDGCSCTDNAAQQILKFPKLRYLSYLICNKEADGIGRILGEVKKVRPEMTLRYSPHVKEFSYYGQLCQHVNVYRGLFNRLHVGETDVDYYRRI